jgi:hypothetical protein
MIPVIMKIALNGTYEQESDEGAADNYVSWPDFLFGYLRPRRSPARPIRTFLPLLLGALFQYRARKQAVSYMGNRLLTRAVLSDLSRRGRE